MKWNKDELKNIINYLLTQIKIQDNNEYYKYELAQLIKYLNIYGYNFKDIVDNQSKKEIKKLNFHHMNKKYIEDDRLIQLETFKNFLPFLEENKSNLNRIFNINWYKEVPEIDIEDKNNSFNKKIILVKETLSSINPKIKIENIHTSKNISNSCFPISSLNKFLITINQNDNILDASVLIHEIGHSYLLSKKSKSYNLELKYKDSIFVESLPGLFQLLLADDLEKKGMKKEAFYIRYELLTIIKNSMILYKNIDDIYGSKTNKHPLDLECKIYSFIYGYLLSFKLFDLYKNDKNLIEQFIQNYGTNDDIALLKTLNIKSDEFNSEYVKTKIKEIKKNVNI